MSNGRKHGPDALDREPLDGQPSVSVTPRGEKEIQGRRYITPHRLADMLGITVRTLGRWDTARIGPPKIKLGNVILFDLAKVPEWLAARESELIRNRRH